MAVTNETFNLNLNVNGDKARKELSAVAQSTRDIMDANKTLRTEMVKLEAAGEKNSQQYKDMKANYKANASEIEKNNSKMTLLRNTIGLSAMTIRELRGELSRLKKAQELTAPGTKEWDEYSKKIKETSARLSDLGQKTQSTSGILEDMKGLLPALGFGAALGGAGALGSKIIEVRQEFEKYEAILLNTLGSQTLATEAMDMLRNVAADLPLSLQEATESYITMVNRGMKPTSDEMVSLTDMALSQGKSLNQFVEAMLDAQTGEFERLKEFGVKAKKEGDNVTFTFKEQATTVKNSEDAINAYLLGLGKLPGVAGSSAAVMNTLEGAFSNAGDATDKLYNAMGEGGLGEAVKSVVKGYSELVSGVADYIALSPSEKLRDEQVELNALVGAIISCNDNQTIRNQLIGELKMAYPEFIGDIQSEAITNEFLVSKLKEVNAEYVRKIQIAVIEEDIADITKRQTEAMREQREMLKGINQQYFEKVKNAKEDATLEERLIELAKLKKTITTTTGTSSTTQTVSNDAAVIILRDNLARKQQQIDELTKEYESLFVEKLKVPGANPEAPIVPIVPDPIIPPGGAKKTIDVAQITPINTDALAGETKKQLDDLDQLMDSYISEFTSKWDAYNQLLGDYGMGFEQADTHDLATAQLQQWHDEQLISEQEFQDAKAAIAQIAEQDKLIRDAETRDMQLEMKALDLEQEQFNFDAQLMLEDERFQLRLDMEKAYYDKEVMLAGGNKDRLLQIELNHKKQLSNINAQHIAEEQKIVKGEMALQMGRLNVAESVAGGIAAVAGKETFVYKAALIAKQGFALAEATMALGIGQANTAKVGFPQNVPLIAAFIAQTAGFINTIRSVGKKSGGYTDSHSSDDEVVDYVHANEFVANANAVRNPTVKPVLDIINMAQRNGTIQNINLSSALSHSGGRGFKDGGYTTPSTAPTATQTTVSFPPELMLMIADNTRVMSKLQAEGVNAWLDYTHDQKTRAKMSKLEMDVSG